ncbi:MAG TPA: hypothetical protein VIX17_18410, partial [Pyrinomonadaceae bacterium]
MSISRGRSLSAVSVLVLTFSGAVVTHFYSIATAQEKYPSNLYSGLRWRNIGPFRAGRVNAVTGVIGQPSVYYFGSVGGG